MMQIKKISLDNKSDLEFVEKLYIESFPPDERRSVLHMQHLMSDEDRFSVNIFIDQDNNRIGFLNYWKFDTFIYMEHLAIAPEYRSLGYGQEVVNVLIKETALPLLAEIELPSSSHFAEQRLKFYERLGFKSWDIEYEQPPYEDGFNSIPMLLLTYRDLDLNIYFEHVCNQLYTEVYKKK